MTFLELFKFGSDQCLFILWALNLEDQFSSYWFLLGGGDIQSHYIFPTASRLLTPRCATRSQSHHMKISDVTWLLPMNLALHAWLGLCQYPEYRPSLIYSQSLSFSYLVSHQLLYISKLQFKYSLSHNRCLNSVL